MFVSEELAYIQLQKTACSHIAALLQQLFDGEKIGKHNPAPPELIDSDRLFISSMRNPWDWYLSLWTYGVLNRGGLRERLTRRAPHRLRKLNNRGTKRLLPALYHELHKQPQRWLEVYDSAESVGSFRRWMRMLHDPVNRYDLGELYGDSMVGQQWGLMSYRYLSLCCREPQQLHSDASLQHYEGLVEYDKRNCYIDTFIHQENLEESFCQAVEKVRPLSEEERAMVYSGKKTNTSKRALTLSEYYDDETVELVRRRDSLLVEKFGYSPTQL